VLTSLLPHKEFYSWSLLQYSAKDSLSLVRLTLGGLNSQTAGLQSIPFVPLNNDTVQSAS